MKIDLYNPNEFIDLNHLQEVTSPILFQRGGTPDPNGLISNQIFGITTKSRKETFAYINLHGKFFNPIVYKAILRFFRGVEQIIDGTKYYSINKEGHLYVDEENGDTGIEFLYNNWEKIKWEYSDTTGMRNERLDLVLKSPKNQVFIENLIVIPAFYRDVRSTENGSGETSELNQYYASIIRYASGLEDRNMFDFQFNSTNANIQETLVNVYDYFAGKLKGKSGLIRKYLMGKNVDNCTRTVITCPQFHADRPEDLFTDLRHSVLPISQICSLCYPYMIKWLKDFFEREVFDTKTSKIVYNPNTDTIDNAVQIKNPESIFTDKYLKKKIDTFIRDPESRFDKIQLPSSSRTPLYLALSGKRYNSTNTTEVSGLVKRPMTWTDLLYIAAVDVTKDKHCLITRYPLLDEFGIFISEIRVGSTLETEVVSINDKVYDHYPKVDFTVAPENIGTLFIDSTQFSNSYLPGLDGDYDGKSLVAIVKPF